MRKVYFVLVRDGVALTVDEEDRGNLLRFADEMYGPYEGYAVALSVCRNLNAAMKGDSR